MIEWIIRNWALTSNLGVNPQMSLSYRRKVVLTNQLSVIFFALLMGMSFIGWASSTGINFFSILSIFTMLTVPYFNYLGFHKYSGFMIAVLTPFFTLIFTTVVLTPVNNSIDILNYLGPRLVGLAYLIFPFVLIDIKNKYLIIIAILFNLLCLFSFDAILNYLQVGFFQVSLIHINYYYINVYVGFSVAFIMLGLFFLIGINSKYENEIIQMADELTDKNNVLNQQNDEISTQNETIQKSFSVIEQKNRNITDSIQYAKRIQHSFLPAEENIKQIFPNSFVVYIPRDIVSGDFYWFKEIDGFKIAIAADCTGHGVPGAFLSVLGNTLLNDIILTRRIVEPHKILEELRTLIKTSSV